MTEVMTKIPMMTMMMSPKPAAMAQLKVYLPLREYGEAKLPHPTASMLPEGVGAILPPHACLTTSGLGSRPTYVQLTTLDLPGEVL